MLEAASLPNSRGLKPVLFKLKSLIKVSQEGTTLEI